MKVTKKLNESAVNKLLEEEEKPVVDNTDGAIDVATDSADDAAAEIEAASGGEIDLSTSEAAAHIDELKTFAQEIGAPEALVLPTEDAEYDYSLGVENKLTKALDAALAKTLKNRRRKVRVGANILVDGLPGSSKTATVMDWVKHTSPKLHVFYLDAKNADLSAYISGYAAIDPEDPGWVKQAYSKNLEPLERENSILFLDELNRADASLRSQLFTLIQEHTVPRGSTKKDAKNDDDANRYEFKNLLFTIACINPILPGNKDTKPLDPAEIGRFAHKLTFDSDTGTTANYLTKLIDKKIRELNPDDEYYQSDLEDYLRIEHLGNFILSHPKFLFDTREVAGDFYRNQDKGNSQRTFTDGLILSDGNPKEFLDWVEETSGYAEVYKEMFTEILADYVKPTFEDLLAKKKMTLAKPTTKAKPVTTHVDDVEDDEFFASFSGSGSTGKGAAHIKNGAETKNAIMSTLDSFLD